MKFLILRFFITI